LQLVTAAGVETHWHRLSDPVEKVELISASKPLALQVDPDSQVFRRLQAGEAPTIMRDITLNPQTLTVIASRDYDFSDAAALLAPRLLDTPPRLVDADDAIDENRPLLLIVDFKLLKKMRRRLKLKEVPQLMTMWHSGGAWTTRRESGAPVLVVTARDGPALNALLRPLPHYGGQSYALFDGGSLNKKSVWPVERGPLYREF